MKQNWKASIRMPGLKQVSVINCLHQSLQSCCSSSCPSCDFSLCMTQIWWHLMSVKRKKKKLHGVAFYFPRSCSTPTDMEWERKKKRKIPRPLTYMQVVFKYWPEVISITMAMGRHLTVLCIIHVRRLSHFHCLQQLGFIPRTRFLHTEEKLRRAVKTEPSSCFSVCLCLTGAIVWVVSKLLLTCTGRHWTDFHVRIKHEKKINK